MQIKRIKYYPTPYFLAQTAHVLLGALAVMAPIALSGELILGRNGTIGILIYMVIKEFVFDIWVEGDTDQIGWKDLFWLCIGLAGAWLLILAKWAIKFL